MLFLLVFILLAVGIICASLYVSDIVDSEFWCWFSGSTLVVGASGFLVSVICFGSYIGIEGNVANNQQRYEILNYQVETQMYNNDNEYGKQELMQKVQEWNEDLAWNKANQRNFWIGIYIPNIYDQFEYIDYTGVK